MALIVPKVVGDAERFVSLCVAIGICISDQQIILEVVHQNAADTTSQLADLAGLSYQFDGSCMQRLNSQSIVWRQCSPRFPWTGIAGHVFDLDAFSLDRIPHFVGSPELAFIAR
jgi:hypothetical protein